MKDYKRTIYEMKCDCGYAEVLINNPPKEKQCPVCKEWHNFAMISWTGPDKFNEGWFTKMTRRLKGLIGR